jgi:Prokaryotic E2 family E
VTSPTSLLARLEQERALLFQAYPAAIINTETLVVVLPGFRLPPGWSHDTTDVLFVIPANYPAGQPDNVCCRPDLTLAGGSPPGNSQGVHIHDGRLWLQFSYHLEPGDWCPRADASSGSTLAHYLVGALTRFDEAS